VTGPAGRPPWQSVTLGVIAAFVLVGALAGAVLAIWMANHDATAVPPESALPSAQALASGAPSPGFPSARPSSAADSGLRATIDPTLLAVLPTSVNGLAVTEFPEAETNAVTDPDLGRNVARVATAFVGDAAGTNWAYTSVVDVRPAARSDAFYRDWQESFDASACQQAGGVTGHTTITIATRSVERTACGGGVRTYHVRIVSTGLLISISDLGPANFAEVELAALRP